MPMSLLGTQFALAWIGSHLIEWLKQQKWFPFARYGAFWLNAATSAVTALVTAGAFTYTFTADGSFSLAGNIYTTLGVLWNAVIQYAMQHFFFKTTIAPPPTPTLTQAAMEKKEQEGGK